jgi:uncharacterized protein (DUF362 family)
MSTAASSHATGISDARVAVQGVAAASYPCAPPFHPNVAYPEYVGPIGKEPNLVYAGIRELLRHLDLDSANYGKPGWNPLGEIVGPGDKVVLKPNLLWHSHKYRPTEWEQIITHGSVVRAVLDYVLIALHGRGEVVIADGPQQDANWQVIMERTGLDRVCDDASLRGGAPVRLLDLRDLWIDVRGDVVYRRVPLSGDPLGGTVVNLGRHSRLAGHLGEGRFYGADYDMAETNAHHSDGRQEYRLSRTALGADVFINLPKLKTHKKVGVTLCLKNLVGINNGRNWLPHHTEGDPSNGGDQFPDASLKNRSERWGVRALQGVSLKHPRGFAPLFRLVKAVAAPVWGKKRQVIRNGNWHKNDTCWRMVHDINRCLLYSNGAAFPAARAKRFFAVVDGIVAGHGNGPAEADRLEAGVLIAGTNPVAVDCVGARLMGFDPQKIPMLREAFASSPLPLAGFAYDDIQVVSGHPGWNRKLRDVRPEDCFSFRPHFGWKGHIEWDGQAEDRGHLQAVASCQ